jgi:glutamine cyclotransferase
MIRQKLLILLLALVSLTAGCTTNIDFQRLLSHVEPAPDQFTVQTISKRPHDKGSFIEGLVWHNGIFYESAGLTGVSDLREVDPQTGQVTKKIKLDPQYFGEGLALNGDKLVQLTWHQGIAFVYDRATFERVGSFSYEGEGWGLCFDGTQYYMTNGSATIVARDPNTFAVTRELQIKLDGNPVTQLNELECVDDSLYVNIWHTNNILQIDKATAVVTGVIDASGLLTEQETADAGSEGVLNGIAYAPDLDTFFITGKNWPWLFEVRFVAKP